MLPTAVVDELDNWKVRNGWRSRNDAAAMLLRHALDPKKTSHKTGGGSLSGLQHIAVPRASGIYFLCKRGQINYVGQSKAVYGRIAAHAKAGRIPFDEAYFQSLPHDQLDKAEVEAIARLKPPYNISAGATNKVTAPWREAP
jgi:hypothetical protein